MRCVHVTLVVAAIAVIGPAIGATASDPMFPSMMSQLQTIRSQIELHDIQNPGDPFDPARGWSQLVDANYLQTAPRNYLAEGRTKITASRRPDPNAGWAWAPDATGHASTLTVRARDINGIVLDTDADIVQASSALLPPKPPRSLAALVIGLAVLVPPVIAWAVGRKTRQGHLPNCR